MRQRLRLLQRWAAAAAAAAMQELTGKLAELLRVSQRLQHSVLTLQNRVPLVQLLDVFFQHLHLLANSVHQVTLDQVLNRENKSTVNKVNLEHSFDHISQIN